MAKPIQDAASILDGWGRETIRIGGSAGSFANDAYRAGGGPGYDEYDNLRFCQKGRGIAS